MSNRSIVFQRVTSAALALCMTLALVCTAPGFFAWADDTATATSSSATADTIHSGNLYVTGYTVLDAAGNEVQTVSSGEKCQIIVALKDSRFSAIPENKDPSGNIVNVKITSTAAFASPSFGDIKQTTPRIENNELTYAIIFNDITYLGGENTLTFDVAYVGNQVAMQAVSCGISQCQAAAKTAGSKASLMVKQASYGDTAIEAGQVFTLTLTTYNTSKTAALTDVKTTINLPASLALASGSNAVLTEKVAAGGTYTTTFQLQALSSAETGVANITVDYQYYLDGTDTALTASQMIAVPIEQPDRFSFTSVDVPTQVYAGEEITITANYVNKGKGVLYNLSASITADGGTAGATDPYLGNLNSGTKGSADFTVKTQSAGTISGTLVITYEDINGVEKQQSAPFTVTVLQAQTTSDNDTWADTPAYSDEAVVQEGIPLWVWGLLVVVVIVVVVIVVKKVRKKKEKQRAEMLAEDDDDEDF